MPHIASEIFSLASLKRRWSAPNGYRQVLTISLPLVVSMASRSVMEFTDRVFLATYSLDSIAAVAPASITAFLFLSFFMGVAGYVNVFIAQYTGAGQEERVGAALWQGMYFAVFAGAALASLYFAAEPLFAASGHPPGVRQLEVSYFRILSLGGGFTVLSVALSCFYSGRGITRPVMIVNALGAGVNIPLDYCLINGFGPFPEMGIAGAGLATIASQALVAVIFLGVVFMPANRARYGLAAAAHLDRDLFKRLLRFGLPGGAEFFLDVFAFTFFIFLVGRLGTVALAAANIVFAINMLAFMPMIGFHIGLSTMVGQALGANQPDQAAFATKSTLHLTLSYLVLVTGCFVLAPEVLLAAFPVESPVPGEAAAIVATGKVILRFVALYSLMDGLGLVFAGALKGAGDTLFVMGTIVACSLSVLMIPLSLALEVFGGGVVHAFGLLTLYISTLALALWLRYRGGKWRGMRVIETPDAPLTPAP